MCHDEIVSVKGKKQGTSARAPTEASGSADNANDAVPIDETVWVLQYFINRTEFKGIDVGLTEKLSWC
jgi:hypothetical protein